MATVTMDVPPPLPPARKPSLHGPSSTTRRPLPELPKETSPTSQTGRQLPKTPPESPKRSLSLPYNHSSPPHTGGHFQYHNTVEGQHHHQQTTHTNSLAPPKLPPRRGSSDPVIPPSHGHTPHQNQIPSSSPMSPPLPPRGASLHPHKNGPVNDHHISGSDDLEKRFHFHPVDDLPDPEKFTNKQKIYLSETYAKKERRHLHTVEELPPL